MVKRLLLSASLFALALPIMAQRALLIGPGVGVGPVMTRNIELRDTSRYYIEAATTLSASGGLDIAYSFDKFTTARLGVGALYRQFKVVPPGNPEGLSFDEITATQLTVSLPLTVHERFALGESEKTWVSLFAGHSFDFTLGDSSTTQNIASGVVDSGAAFTRHTVQTVKRFVPTVLLGAGLDFENEKGNRLNISLQWGISTAKIFKGEVREWESVRQSFDLATQTEPIQFPDHYYEWALRGSYLQLRASYWFNLGDPFSKKED